MSDKFLGTMDVIYVPTSCAKVALRDSGRHVKSASVRPSPKFHRMGFAFLRPGPTTYTTTTPPPLATNRPGTLARAFCGTWEGALRMPCFRGGGSSAALARRHERTRPAMCKNGRAGGWTDRRPDGHKEGRAGRRTDGRTDRRTDGRMDGRTDGRTV